MSAPTITGIDGITLIINDHRNVDGFFDAYYKANNSQEKLRLVAKIVEELTVHAYIEEHELYPLLRSRLGDGEQLYRHALEEHHEARQVLAEIEQLRPSDSGFDDKVRTLIDDVRSHVEEEESDLLPRLREAISDDELVNLGTRMRRAKTSAPVSPSMEAEAMTKDELYDKARDLGVDGRSQMGKDELANEVTGGQ